MFRLKHESQTEKTSLCQEKYRNWSQRDSLAELKAMCTENQGSLTKLHPVILFLLYHSRLVNIVRKFVTDSKL